MAQTNIQTDRQTLKCQMPTILTTGLPEKQNLSKVKQYENRNTCSKVMIEHSLKKINK